jgi:hypothetical protein
LPEDALKFDWITHKKGGNKIKNKIKKRERELDQRALSCLVQLAINIRKGKETIYTYRRRWGGILHLLPRLSIASFSHPCIMTVLYIAHTHSYS